MLLSSSLYSDGVDPALSERTCYVCNRLSHPVNTLNLLGLISSTTYHCQECGLFFRSPLPAEQAVAEYYASRYFRHPDNIEEQMAQTQGGWITSVLHGQGIALDSVNYIEFGAGRGWLVSFMRDQGVASAIGYEPDCKSVEWGRRTFKVSLCEGFWSDTLDPNMPSDGVVILSLAHVLEHLHNPLKVLASFREQYAHPYVFIEVPDAHWEGPVMAVDTFPHSSMGQHFWSFTEQSLEVLLNSTGFSVVALEKDGDPHFWDNRLAQLKIWNQISTLYREWEKQSFNVKDGAVKSLEISVDCFLTGVKMRLKRLSQRRAYDRLDLPIIRILAKATS